MKISRAVMALVAAGALSACSTGGDAGTAPGTAVPSKGATASSGPG
ncbi:hypothetical protein ACLGIH_32595 [Streptomyces sp. HMX87]